MSTAIIITIILIICIFAVKKYIKNLRQGCCGSGAEAEKRLCKNADISGLKYKYTVTISGMKCENCAVRIENNFYRQGLVAFADHKKGTAEVFSEQPVSDFVLRQTITGLGYTIEGTELSEM